jgi:hypothetical protein
MTDLQKQADKRKLAELAKEAVANGHRIEQLKPGTHSKLFLRPTGAVHHSRGKRK